MAQSLVSKQKYSSRKVRLEYNQEQLDTLPVLAQMFAKGNVDRFLSRFAKRSIDGMMTDSNSTSFAKTMSDYLESIWHGKPIKARVRNSDRIAKVIDIDLKLTAGQIRAIEILAEIQGMTFNEVIAFEIADEIRGMMTVALDCGAKSQERKFAAVAYKIWGGDEKCYLNIG